MRITLVALSFCALTACQQSASNNGKDKESTTPAATTTADAIPDTRETVKKEPVAQYSERTDNPLNDWYFSVKLYETSKTFHYRMVLKYEEIEGVDTLKLPNLGVLPEPVIKKGAGKFDCIIGFLDKDKQFREYKEVYVKNGSIKVTALRHYSVSPK